MSNVKIITLEDDGLMHMDRFSPGFGMDSVNWHPKEVNLTEKERKSKKLDLVIDGKSFKVRYSKNKKSGGFQFYCFPPKQNGYVLARELVSRHCPNLNLDEHLSTTGTRNVLPIIARLEPSLDVRRLFKKEVPDLIVDRLTGLRAKVIAELRNRFGAEFTFKEKDYFILTSLELTLDVMSPAGDCFGTSDEIALRLCQLVKRASRGIYLDHNGSVIPVPKSWLHLKRLYSSSVACGLPCYHGYLSNGIELVVYLKEIPDRKVFVGAEPQWLQRFEFRINRNYIISRPSAHLKQLLGSNRFRTGRELEQLLSPLKSKLFQLLFEALNVQYNYTDRDLLKKIERLIEDACPYRSLSLFRALTSSPGSIATKYAVALGIIESLRVNWNESGTGLFHKPGGAHGRHYTLNWKHLASLVKDGSLPKDCEAHEIAAQQLRGEE